ncbi:permease [candidate division FCPU426 bacterium]|nr:permease [candidate division FCPU426 bacterium]
MFILSYLSELWKILTELAPWLFLGASMAGLLKIFLPRNFISTHMGGSSVWSILKTTLLGIPLPLCSCGVLPATLGLKKDGASNGAAVGFLISTPQTGIDSILVTSSFLGWPLALFKVGSALVTGLLGGLFVQATETKGISTPVHPLPEKAPMLPPRQTASKWRIVWNYSIHELIGGIYIYLAAGLVIAALISTLFPTNALAQMPALQGMGGMLLMLGLSIPIYVCTTGSVPIAASLIAAGLPVGSALVFLMAGPATNIATLSAVTRSFGARITAIYLGTVVLASMVFGLVFQSTFLPTPDSLIPLHQHHTAWYYMVLNHAAAVLLTALMLRWAWQDLQSWWRRLKGQRPAQQAFTLRIKGMSCKNCAVTVRRSLEQLPNVRLVSVQWENGTARIQGDGLDFKRIAQVIHQAGYEVISPEKGASHG